MCLCVLVYLGICLNSRLSLETISFEQHVSSGSDWTTRLQFTLHNLGSFSTGSTGLTPLNRKRDGRRHAVEAERFSTYTRPCKAGFTLIAQQHRAEPERIIQLLHACNRTVKRRVAARSRGSTRSPIPPPQVSLQPCHQPFWARQPSAVRMMRMERKSAPAPVGPLPTITALPIAACSLNAYCSLLLRRHRFNLYEETTPKVIPGPCTPEGPPMVSSAFFLKLFFLKKIICLFIYFKESLNNPVVGDNLVVEVSARPTHTHTEAVELLPPASSSLPTRNWETRVPQVVRLQSRPHLLQSSSRCRP